MANTAAQGGDALVGTAPPRLAGIGQGITIVVAGFLPIMAIVSLAPALPSIIGHFAGLANVMTLAPLMVTAPGLMIAIFSPGMGWAADKVGRRPILLVATFIYGLLGIAPFFMSHLTPIFASRLGLGICEAAILTVTNTIIGDYFAPSKRRLWLTVQGIVGPIFGTSVIALSGQLTSHFWNGSFLIYAVAFAVFLAMLLFIYEPAKGAAAHDVDEVKGLPFPWTKVLVFSAVTLFASTLYYVYIVQAGLAFDAVGVKSPKQLGLLISIASVGVLVGAILFGFLSKRLTPGQLVAVFLGLFGLGLLGIGLSHDPRLTTALAVIQQLGAGMAVPSLVFWATGVLSAEHRGAGMGFWSASFFLGQFTSPLLVGLARGATGGILGAFVLMGAVALAGAVVAILVSRRSRLAVA